MNYFRGGRLVISCMDMRANETSLLYKGGLFNSDFSSSQFAELFPHSSSFDLSGTGIQSLFEMNTGEQLNDIETYMVMRWSKDNLFAQPTVEFTFSEGKLIYMFFANF